MTNNSECNAGSQTDYVQYVALYKVMEYFVHSMSMILQNHLQGLPSKFSFKQAKLNIFKCVKQGTMILDIKM
jgi:hypothetical protein